MMSRWSKIAKMLGVSEDVVKSVPKDAVKLLENVNTVEAATALKGPERAKYLNALDLIYGDQNTRAKSMGFGDRTWYHGTTVPIDEFQKEALGLSTNAQSAKRGFFFAQDPSTASDYAELARERGLTRDSIREAVVNDKLNKFQDEMIKKYGPTEMNFGNGPVESWESKLTSSEKENLNNLKLEQNFELAKQLSRDIDKKMDTDFMIKDMSFDLNEKNRLINVTKNSLDNINKIISVEPRDSERYQELVQKAQSYSDRINSLTKESSQIQSKLANFQDQVNSVGQNVIPVRLKGNPDSIHVKNYKGQGYRDTSYADEMAQARAGGKDAVLFKNTYDPADPNNRVKQDIAAVFEPNQIRSSNAAFDPRFKDSAKILAGTGAVPLSGQDFDLIDTIKNFNMDVLEPMTQPVVSRYNKLKSMITEPLANELDLSRDKSNKKNIKQVLDMAVDPVNLIGGAPGVAAGTIQLLGEEDEEENGK